MIDAKEQYISVKPKNEKLRPYIAYYYFNTSCLKGYEKAFTFYPHYRNAITIYKNSKISFADNTSKVKPDESTGFQIIYSSIYLQSRTGYIEAPFSKVGIVFQALGINNFLKEPFSDVIKASTELNFDYFGKTFNKTLQEVYNTDHIDAKVEALDVFFLNQLRPLRETRIGDAIAIMFKENLTITDLAERLQISRKTLLRLFRKHLNCSPKEFYTLIKFRKAMEIYQTENPSLTDLAYKNGYYDQSDFIKHFRKVTGFNPKKFFKGLTHLGTEDTFWTVLNSK